MIITITIISTPAWSSLGIYDLSFRRGELRVCSSGLSRGRAKRILWPRVSPFQVWDIREGKCVQTFRGHESDINSVMLFPDGKVCGTWETLDSFTTALVWYLFRMTFNFVSFYYFSRFLHETAM